MSENAKTVTFVLVGVVAIAIGIFSAPTAAEVDENSLVGKDLSETFHDPEVAKRLRIVRFDEDTATLRQFEVAEKDGLWTIPSKDGYPADAAKQMAEAATSLMDRKILSVASKNAGDHEQYGVIDPLSPKLEPGQKGVGTRVTMSDAQNKPLVDLIVGKPVREREGQRYVREAGRDAVFVIEIDPAKLSTDFENWIEKDLLKLNAWDLQQVEVKDYSAELQRVVGPQGQTSIGVAWDPRSEMTLAYSDADAKWTPAKIRKFDPKKGDNGEYVDYKLGDDEELNTETLNSLKTALSDLKIVDVERKPQGLSQNLKAGEEFLNNREALLDLRDKGFAAISMSEGAPREIISSDGEVDATLKNGAEYVLRFGNLTNVAGSGQDKDKDDKAAADKTAADGKAKKGDKNDVHRYLFVMARFNKDAVKQPELAKLPDLPAKAEAKQDAAPASDANKEKDAKDEKKDDKAEAATKADDKGGEAKESKTADAGDAAKAAESADKKADAASKKEGAPDPEVEKIIAERKQIEQENQKKLDEYQALIKKGQDTVKDLNLRFGDWYFVVNDDIFQKLRVSSDKVIKHKDKKAEGNAAGAAEGKAAPAGIPGLPAIPGASK
ncbi:MAG TPA: DUF4340 domain-containing protein [Lacipirellulaceae bacterium]|jgi:hypothetical protein|nr:DUF4340 domain-containing protein [Lacipirellulaceae bacterium]